MRAQDKGNKMEKIAIFGGSFNPIHLGHQIIAQFALNQFNLDRVIFVPARFPPHKKLDSQISDADRLQLIKAVVQKNDRFGYLDFELQRDEVSYTIDTVRYLSEKGYRDIHLIIGADLIPSLLDWKEIEELQTLVKFVVGSRGGFNMEKTTIPVEQFLIPSVEISSSMIRSKIKELVSIRYLVDETVFNIIEENGFYK